MSNRDFSRFLTDTLRPIKSRISMMVARSVVALVHDDLKMQGLQLSVMAGENKDDIERFQNYGVTSVPHPGAEAVVVFLGGNRDHGIAIAVDDRRYRIKGLQNGEVAIYTDEDQNGGHRVHMKRGRVVDVICDTLNVTADNDINISANNITLNAESELVENSAAHRVNTSDYEALKV